jgi:hypothetical protein
MFPHSGGHPSEGRGKHASRRLDDFGVIIQMHHPFVVPNVSAIRTTEAVAASHFGPEQNHRAALGTFIAEMVACISTITD